MIKTLSPYYLTIPFVIPVEEITCTSYTLKIYIWDGVKATPPVDASYSITKNNPTASTGSDKINVARLINDYIDFMPATGIATGLIDGDNQRWVKFTVSYPYIIEEVTVISTVNLGTELVLKGYSYGMDGENANTPSNRFLMSGTEFKVNRTGVFNVPIKILEV